VRAAVAALLLTLLAALAIFVPAATRTRVVFSSTPNPPPLFELTLLELPPADRACTLGIVLGADAELLRINVLTLEGSEPVPLALRLSGPGYSSVRTLREYPPGGAVIDVAIPRADRTTPATLCFTNAGTRPLALGATTESRTRSRTATVVNGKPTAADPTIQLLRRETRSFAALLPTLMERAATFKPGFAGAWLFWVLAALLAVGLPLGTAVALAVEPRQRDAEAAHLQQDEAGQDDRRVPTPERPRQGAAGHGDPDGHQ
jgi:hypothetical protein